MNNAPQPPIEDAEGMSLDQLSKAFAAIRGHASGSDSAPLIVVSPSGNRPLVADGEDALAESNAPAKKPDDSATVASDDSFQVSAQSILEAVLFVGRPDNTPISAEQLSDLMRGVSVEEIEHLVAVLNERYAADACPYGITSEGAGYRMVLRKEYGPLRDRFYGRIRAARLSPAAIEVLSLVAYNQPITADEVNRRRGTASGNILSQLVRRRLLQLQRTNTKPKKIEYTSTRRFLEIFGLKSLDDLPRTDDLAKN